MLTTWRDSEKHPVVGVLGGGQLARMILQASISLGIEVHILALEKDESTKDIATHYETTASFGPAEIYQFARRCDVITFEHELVDPEVLRGLEERGCNILPSSKSMKISTDKAAQRRFLSSLALPVPRFLLANSFAEVEGFSTAITPPFVLKSSKGGYDGRGVIFAENVDQVAEILGRGSFEHTWVMEPHLKIDAELAVVTVRSKAGNSTHYPPFRTYQRNGICAEVRSPCAVSEELLKQAIDLALMIAQETDSVGVQAVEFFITEGTLVVNELAPRVHNSAHLTIDANVTSQFENHLRAVLGLDLGDTSLLSPAAMVNLVASEHSPLERINLQGALLGGRSKVHIYDKTMRAGRKVGHITVLDDDVDKASELAHQAASRALSTETSA